MVLLCLDYYGERSMHDEHHIIEKHLNALKENGIMTQIENPERRVELRQWVCVMLMRSA